MPARILVCDDEAGVREMLGVLLRRAGYAVELVEAVEPALAAIRDQPPYDAVITDLALPDGTGMDVLVAARDRDEGTQVVMITAYATTEQAVSAMRLGAYDYIQKPFRNQEMRALLEKALEKRDIVDQNRILREAAQSREHARKVIARSPQMERIFSLVQRIASAKTSVLVTGESGTGKEMIARALHDEGERKDAPFVVVNCGAIPEALMESELFGHEKGSFTGAAAKKDGLFVAAKGGTLFLDEIGELPTTLQVKLLRALQERMVRPVGAAKEIEVDVRVVAATNRDIEADVQKGTFRQDLFYRLNVIRIHLPPLRERPEDVPVLAEHFLRKHAALAGKRLAFAPEAIRWIVAQPFPGNVRELENVVERAVTLSTGQRVTVDDLDARLAPTPAASVASLPALVEGFDLDAWLAEQERGLLVRALEHAGGNQTAAAKLLGTTFRSFRYRLRKLGIVGEGEDSPSES
ncbi:MAG: sigma-54 dependent transcriptional regulator [Sandaracinus sp.]